MDVLNQAVEGYMAASRWALVSIITILSQMFYSVQSSTPVWLQKVSLVYLERFISVASTSGSFYGFLYLWRSGNDRKAKGSWKTLCWSLVPILALGAAMFWVWYLMVAHQFSVFHQRKAMDKSLGEFIPQLPVDLVPWLTPTWDELSQYFNSLGTPGRLVCAIYFLLDTVLVLAFARFNRELLAISLLPSDPNSQTNTDDDEFPAPKQQFNFVYLLKKTVYGLAIGISSLLTVSELLENQGLLTILYFFMTAKPGSEVTITEDYFERTMLASKAKALLMVALIGLQCGILVQTLAREIYNMVSASKSKSPPKHVQRALNNGKKVKQH